MAGHDRHQRTAVRAQPDIAVLSTLVFNFDTAAELFEHRDSSLDPLVDGAAALGGCGGLGGEARRHFSQKTSNGIRRQPLCRANPSCGVRRRVSS
jgi:hypothetical protein